MATYAVRLSGKTVIHKETGPNYHEPVLIVPFSVGELGYSDRVELAQAEFTKAKAKALVKDKIVAFLERKAEEEEYEVTI